MKKIFVLVFVLLSLTMPAQTLTLKLGLDHATQYREVNDHKYDVDSGLNLGFLAGLNFDFDLKNDWTLAPGLYFETKGWRDKVDISSINITSDNSSDESFILKNKLFYINIPVLVKKSFQVNDQLSAYVGAGPYLGFKVSGCITTDAEDASCDYDTKFITDRFKTLDFGLQAETGLVYKQKFVLGISYEYGLSDVGVDYGIPSYDSSLPDTKKETNFKNRVLSLSFGYCFKL